MLDDYCSEIITPALVLAEVMRIERSPLFTQSHGLQRFLHFVVEQTLAGEEDSLKETYLGMALYQKEATYDPREQPVVRVAATRLRDRLEQYYAAEGVDSRIRIDLPKGSYIPIFRWQLQLLGPELVIKTEPPVQVATPMDLVTGEPAWFKRWLLWSMVSVAVLVAVADVSFRLMHGTKEKDGLLDHNFVVLPLTSEPGFALDPAVSPNSQQWAYSWNGEEEEAYNIYARKIRDNNPVKLTNWHEGQALHPAWSPDGHSLAYLYISGRGGELHVLDLTIMKDRKVTDVAIEQGFHGNPLHAPRVIGPVWSRSGRELIYAEIGGPPGQNGFVQLSLMDGKRAVLTRSAPAQQDGYPMLSPDGRKLAFARFTNGSTSAIYLLDMSNLSLLKVGLDWPGIRGIAWDPSGTELIISGNRFRNAYAVWRVPLDGREPQAVASGISYPLQPFFAPDGRSLALTSWNEESSIAQVGVGADGKVVDLFPSVLRSFAAQYSPDGGRIAFVSNRSGSWEIWIANRKGDGLRQLTQLHDGKIAGLAWSPNGRRIAAQAVYQETLRIMLIDSTTGDISPLRIAGFEGLPVMSPAWSNDGQFLYFTSQVSQKMGVWKVASDGIGAPLRVLSQAISQCAEDASGKYLYFTTNEPGVWRLPLVGTESVPEEIPELRSIYPAGNWELVGNQIFLMDSNGQHHRIESFDLTTRQLRPLTADLAKVLFDTDSLSVDPLYKGYLLARHSIIDGSNIMILQQHP